MHQQASPAMESFVRTFPGEVCLAQVLIQPSTNHWDLRHVLDRPVALEKLSSLRSSDLLATVQWTSQGAFRPLRSAPNLKSGWHYRAQTLADLELALQFIYPGAIADWHALSQGVASPQDYREFTSRQSGMYRITTLLTDEQAGLAMLATCHEQFCLKQRRWTVGNFPRETNSPHKSLIPCLEPCAILLEFARKACRIEQEEKINIAWSPSDLESLQAGPALPSGPSENQREADFSDPANPRRRLLAMLKLQQCRRGTGTP